MKIDFGLAGQIDGRNESYHRAARYTFVAVRGSVKVYVQFSFGMLSTGSSDDKSIFRQTFPY